jgi:hypothetical protein
VCSEIKEIAEITPKQNSAAKKIISPELLLQIMAQIFSQQ